jgi:hypothetical protein
MGPRRDVDFRLDDHLLEYEEARPIADALQQTNKQTNKQSAAPRCGRATAVDAQPGVRSVGAAAACNPRTLRSVSEFCIFGSASAKMSPGGTCGRYRVCMGLSLLALRTEWSAGVGPPT